MWSFLSLEINTSPVTYLLSSYPGRAQRGRNTGPKVKLTFDFAESLVGESVIKKWDKEIRELLKTL